MPRPDIEGALARAEAASREPWSADDLKLTDADGDPVGGFTNTDDLYFCEAARTDLPAIARYAMDLERDLAKIHTDMGWCGEELLCPVCTAVHARERAL